jgi:2,4-dienoyl-CoA reductase (NADPH2)
MTTGFGFERGVPDETLVAYFRARSGGVSLATVAFGAVAPEGRVEEQLPWMWREDAARALEPLVAAIHDSGARACLQLGHGGRQASPRVTRLEPVAPSPVAAGAHVREAPRELATAEVEGLIGRFGRAAAVAAEAGFDALELHAGHGYLVHQFLSPEANRRSDRFGGKTVAERARFAAEVLDRLRAEAPRLAMLVRINGDDLVPGGAGPAEAAEAAAALEAAGADAFVVSAGVYGSVPYTIPLLDDPEASFSAAARHLRERVRVPVVSVGGYTRPGVAEAALRRGDCDAVALGRALLADPDWVEKAAGGRAGDIRPCIATLESCAGMLQHGEPISCAVNPEVGREQRPRPRLATRPGRVVVVGAGPGGLEAAGRAAELGHSVTLLEREERPGGTLLLGARTPPLGHLTRLAGWLERRARGAGVELRMGAPADAAAVTELEPDLVLVATGARSEPPVLDGYDLLPAWTVEELLAGRPSSLATAPPPARPLVFGGGRAALAAALLCAREGADVTLLSREDPGRDTSGLARRALLARLERDGVTRLRGHPVELVEEGVRWAEENGEPRLAPADALVIADRRVPERPRGLEPEGAELVRVGDARSPRGIAAAVAEGREAVEAFTHARADEPQ